MNRAESMLVYLDTLEGITSDPDILVHSAKARKVAQAAMESRLSLALVTVPTTGEPDDWQSYDHLANTVADISDKYGLEPEDMVTVLEMCEAGLETA